MIDNNLYCDSIDESISEDWKMAKFKVGDRVRLARPDSSDRVAGLNSLSRGTIQEDSTVPFVEFDNQSIVRAAMQDQLELIEDGCMKKERQFIIGSRYSRSKEFSVSENPFIHSDEDAAKKEAERCVCLCEDGVEFFVLEIVGSVQKATSPVVWK
jgi:hypothetical protein